MKRLGLALLVALGLSAPARAEVALVDSGEHDSFTRIVVTATDSSGWSVGRTVDGYELAMPGLVTGYDLREAFAKIPKDRVVALWQDPASGRLRFSLACACHVIAFEFRAGIVVLDIRNGPAPEGSSFEVALPGTEPAADKPVEAATTSEPAARPYDWVDLARSGQDKAKVPALPLPLPTGEVSLDPLRDALLGEISQGVAQGVIDIAEGAAKPQGDRDARTEDAWARVGLGELPGVSISGGKGGDKRVTADGRACLPDRTLDIASWGQGDRFVTAIGLARSGMLGEFDAPSDDAVLRSVRFHLFLGFGVEARQFLGFLPPDRPADRRALMGMAHIMDGEVPPDNPFAGMEVCDGNAALWAVLAQPPDQPVPAGTNQEAVARSFSALPPHLRRYLGGTLVDRFLASGDKETARKLRDAILRLPASEDPEVALMDARYQLADGHEAAASELATDVMSEAGPATPKAAITLVEAAFRGDQTLDPLLPASLEVFLRDAAGSGLEDQLLRATVLAQGMAGDFAAATAHTMPDAETLSDLWSMLVPRADDDTFLTAAANQQAPLASLRPDVATLAARRLLDLGLARLALDWIAPTDAESPPQARLLEAEARLAVGDAPAVRRILAGLDGAEAARLNGLAALQLGDLQAAAQELTLAGQVDAGLRAATWTQDWDYVQAAGPDSWKAAADLPGTAAGSDGTIAGGKALLEESETARRTIEDLLAGAVEPSQSQ